MHNKKVSIVGSGVVGLTVADYLCDEGFDITLYSASQGADESCCSWWAGGMLALNCELETAEPIIGVLGKESIEYWRKNAPDFIEKGSLVLATPRDNALLGDFKQNTEGWRELNASDIKALEPDVSDSFLSGLVFENEAHITPRLALAHLTQKLADRGVSFKYGTHLSDDEVKTLAGSDSGSGESGSSFVVDCRGMGAKSAIGDLRGVKGEMLYLQSDEIELKRPVRLLHPRIPIYIVPRDNGVFMLGASMIENEAKDHASVRSVMELLSAAYAVNPAFAEASILEIGVDLRPAYPDNAPAIEIDGNYISVNGMYRHGYLAAPAMARHAKDYICHAILPTDVLKTPKDVLK